MPKAIDLKNIPSEMANANRWLLYDKNKHPFYISGHKRHGKLDGPEDLARLSSLANAIDALLEYGDRFVGIGFALGPDGDRYWQGIDVDIKEGNTPTELQQTIIDTAPGYVEYSPSGRGVHAIGLGSNFPAIGAVAGLGIEAYSRSRYFTVTTHVIRSEPLTDLLPIVDQVLRPHIKKKESDQKLNGQIQIGEGGRNDTLFKHGASMKARGYSDAIIETLLLALNQEICVPPLEDAEVLTIAHNTLRRYETGIMELPGSVEFDDGFVDASTELQTGFWERREVRLEASFNFPAFLIQGFLDDKLTVIAGSPAVGKTSCLVPLAVIVAGFIPEGLNFEVELPRKVFYVSEDPSQVNRILYGIRKHTVLRDGSSIGFDALQAQFHIISTQRSSIRELKDLANYVKSFINQHEINHGKFEVKPLVVFDTAPASFDMKEENSNSEASAFIGAIKNKFCEEGIAVWVVAHTPKSLSRADVNDLTIRGASAFVGDANTTAFLFQEDGLDARFMRLAKRRFEADFEEIQFTSEVHYVQSTTPTGREVEARYRFSTIGLSSQEVRESAKAQKAELVQEAKDQQLRESIKQVVIDTPFISRNKVIEILGGKKSKLLKVISEMLEERELVELNLPSERLGKGAKTYLSLEG